MKNSDAITEQERIERSIAALEMQRASLGEAVVEPAIAALREKLAALAPPAPTRQQRKQITVLFADVSGFTAMSAKMDVEEVTEVMNVLWERLDKVITHHGGVIDKHIGDAVMALWGAETAREDDPERAIRAVLAMQAEVATLREELGVQLAMRIGLNTGPVLLGAVGTTGEYTAMGDTVNLASRLEQAAPLNGILVSHDTYRHVRGVFDVQVLEPIQVKGKAEPIQVYLVERAKPRAFRKGTRGVGGVETRMIGREAELKRLQDAFYTTMDPAGGERRVVTIVGEAGVGKSRLLYEFDIWSELRPGTFWYFKGRASQEMQNLPYALMRDLFAFRFQIQDSDRAEVVRAKIVKGVCEALGGARPEQSQRDGEEQAKAHFIGQLLGFDFSASPHLQGVLDDAKQIHDRALIYLCDYFKAMAAQQPVLVLLEDLHWADNSSLDVINRLALALAGQPVLIVCAARPILFERRPDWSEGQAFHTRLELGPLSQRDSRRLVDEVLQKVEQVPEALHALVVSGAEGNPFYVEELINMLIEDDVIIRGEERWRVEPTRLTTVRVPPTLTGVVQARLDSLPEKERTILQQASVVGRTFWDDTVSSINAVAQEAMDHREIPQILSTLGGREMVFRRKTSAFAGTQEYIFKHAVLRTVTYENVLKRVRRVYHALIAGWLIEHSGERAGEVTGLIADHLELAGETARALGYLRQAGEQAAAQFANAEAVNYFSRALSLTPLTDDVGRFDLLLVREKVHDLEGKREAQSQDLLVLKALADALADDRRRGEIALRRTSYAQSTGDYASAIVMAQEAIRLAQSTQDVNTEAAGYLQWGLALMRRGDHETARTQLEQGLNLAQSAQSLAGPVELLRQVEASCLLGLGVVAYNQGDYVGAVSFYEQALRLQRETGARRGESATLVNLGVVASDQGDYVSARAFCEQALRLKCEIGDRTGESLALGNLGNVALQQGDYDSARVCFEQSLSLCREIGTRYGESNALCNLGRVAREQGAYARAKAYFERSLHLFRETGDRYGESHALAGLGLLLHLLGKDEAAQGYSQQALLIAQELVARSVQGDALTVLGHALKGLGRLDDAANVYGQALSLRQGLNEHNRAMESLAGLARVSLSQGDLTKAQVQVEEILNHLANNTLEGTDEPLRVYLSCYQVFKASGDSRAQEVLAAAYALLQERAAKTVNEELRRSFLKNVATHREIVEQYSESS